MTLYWTPSTDNLQQLSEPLPGSPRAQLDEWRYYQQRLGGGRAATLVALPGEARCADANGGLRCVKQPHPEAPHAHLRVAGHRAWDWDGTAATRTPVPAPGPDVRHLPVLAA
jgi:hypothetical protein